VTSRGWKSGRRVLISASEKNSVFLNRYSQATRLLKQAAVCAGLPSEMEQLASINHILKTIEAAVLSSEDSILKYYHMLQMAEAACYGREEQVRAMRDAYGRLLAIAESFEDSIERLIRSRAQERYR